MGIIKSHLLHKDCILNYLSHHFLKIIKRKMKNILEYYNQKF